MRQFQCTGRSSGISLLWLTICLTVIAGIASFAVDYGRVQVVKFELRRAADAAALAAVEELGSGITNSQNAAVSIAAANTADGKPVSVNASSDIDFGTWDASKRVFTVLTGSARSGADSVRVTVKRTAATGNPVPLTFAQLLGQSGCDVKASAIACGSGGGSYGIVGLSYINMSGKKTDKYNSRKGKYDPATANKGSIGSNGTITLSNYVMVNGDARPGVGKSVVKDGTCIVTGSTAPLTAALSYPVQNAGGFASVNDNAQLGKYLSSRKDFTMSSGTLYLAGGNYYVRNFSLTGSGSMIFSGPATFYITGTLTISGSMTTNLSTPDQLKIYMTSNGKATFSGGSAFYGNFYGPKSPFSLGGTADYFGTIIAVSVDVSGSGGIHYDAADDTTAGDTKLVQ